MLFVPAGRTAVATLLQSPGVPGSEEGTNWA